MTESMGGERQFRAVIASHWLNCGILLLAALVAWQGEILPPLAYKVGYFLLGPAADEEW